jgi:hypothetical protein
MVRQKSFANTTRQSTYHWNVTRAQAEKLLADYFARVEQAIPWTENNPLDGRP